MSICKPPRICLLKRNLPSWKDQDRPTKIFTSLCPIIIACFAFMWCTIEPTHEMPASIMCCHTPRPFLSRSYKRKVYCQWCVVMCIGGTYSTPTQISCYLRATSHMSQELWPWNCEGPKESVQRPSQDHLQNRVLVWSRHLKCSVKPCVTGHSAKCNFNKFLFTQVFTHDKTY